MEFWLQFTVLAGGVTSWFVRLERRLMGKMGIKEHQEICTAHAIQQATLLEEIRTMIERRDDKEAAHQDKASNFRHEMRDKLHAIEMKVAVLSSNNPKRMR